MVGCTNTMVPATLLALLATAIALDPPNPKKDAALPPCGACTNLVSRCKRGPILLHFNHILPEHLFSYSCLLIKLYPNRLFACCCSFEAGMERTKRYKTDGGDTAWEEKKKQSYATSEVTNQPLIL